jgi:predicted secreted protein
MNKMDKNIFTDERSKSILFIAHCIMNQNSKAAGTASYPGTIREIVELLNSTDVGIVQMPCPELQCMGLDRGDRNGVNRSIIEENCRIREEMQKSEMAKKNKLLAQNIVYQMSEYLENGFDIKGVIGINRSPSCGVETTSKDNKEIQGEGVFVQELKSEIKKKSLEIDVIGIKVFEPNEAIIKIKQLLNIE